MKTTVLYNSMEGGASSGWINDFTEEEDDPDNPTWSFKDKHNFITKMSL